MHVRSVSLLAILLFIASAAFGDTLYSQPSVWTTNGNNVGATWTTHVDAGGNGWRAYDNFSLANTSAISGFTFRGIYLDSALQNGAPNTNNWVVSIYSNNAGQPGAALYNDTTATVTSTLLGTGFFGASQVDFYEFSYSFSSAFVANAGDTYWISPQSQATTFYNLFGWTAGTGGDSSTFQVNYPSGTEFTRTSDRAFVLTGAPVPEPASLILFGGGLIGVFRKVRK